MTFRLKRKICTIAVAALVLFNSMSAFATTSRQSFLPSPEEAAFIAEANTITVAISPDNFPYSSIKDGKIVGIIPEMINYISYETGLKLEIIYCEDYKEYNKIKKDKKADVVFATHVSEAEAQQEGYNITDKYMVIPYSKLELRENDDNINKIAVLDYPASEYEVALRYYYNDQIIICKTKQECMDMLNEKKCGEVIINDYEAQDIVYNDVKKKYAVKQLHENEVQISAATRLDENPQLLSILNKALKSMDDITKAEIISRNTQIIDSGDSLSALIYTHPEMVITIVGAFFALVLLMLMLLHRLKRKDEEKDSAERYKKFFGYICVACDSIAEVNLKNKEAKRYVMKDGMVHENIIKNNIDKLFYIHEDDKEEIEKNISKKNIHDIIKNEEFYQFECRMKWNEEDEYHWSNCIIQGIKPSKERPDSFLLMVNDVDDLRKREEEQKIALKDALSQAKQASLAKGQFLSRMSHEIRTPLNAVIGYMAMGKEAVNQPDKMLHCIEKSEVASKHLLSIINDVLDISSIESGKLKIAVNDFDLKVLLSEITAVFYQQAKRKNVRFNVKLDEVSEEWVVGDSLRLNQIIMNLLSNAVKFTPEGGSINLNVHQVRISERKVYINFEVADTGIGMSQEYMQRLFQPFEQESANTAKKYGGSGLGLSITKNLIDMMGGTINVESHLNEGTTFKVSLHFGISSKNQDVDTIQHDYSNVRVLVVDDVEDDGNYIKSLLKRCKVKSDSVTSGKDALKQLRRRVGTDYNYNMCIMDWNMPELNGVETAKEIREKFGSDLPIIIATAYDTSEIEDTAFEAGVNRVIAKPLFQSTMLDILVSNFGKYVPQENEDTNNVDLSGLHIILAEDNEMNMEIAVDVLTKLGINVESAVNGQEACDKFLASEPGTYDMILMDVQMPIMDGYEATQTIRKSNHSEAKTIPIIAMTANAFAEDVTEALAKGMNDHISKPIDKSKLIKSIQKFSKH